MASTLQETVESQKRVIVALQNEVQWLNGVIFNPAFNEVEIRLLVNRTPREMRMGLTHEAPERKMYLPAEAEKIHASPKTITSRIKRLKDAGVVSYRTAMDENTGNRRSFLTILPPLEQPEQITIERPQRGGSTWQDGKRLKRCKDCGSEHLVEVTKRDIICDECGTLQTPTRETRREVNAPYSQDDGGPQPDDEPQISPETPYSQDDSEPSNEEMQEQDRSSDEPTTPYSHRDCETPEEQNNTSCEFPKLPCITVSTVGIPTELCDLVQWVVWRYELKEGKEKPDKIPYQTKGRVPQRAESNDPATWSTLQQAQEFYERSHKEEWAKRFDGIGIMFGNGICGVDLDHCCNKEGEMLTMSQLAYEVMTRLNSYSELSPSGTGVHILVLGKLPDGWRKRSADGIEMYDTGRFFTFTGQHIDGTPLCVMDRQEQLAQVHARFAPPPAPKKKTGPAPTPYSQDDCRPLIARNYTDEEIIDRALLARNGAKFHALWKLGDTSGYPSQSEADQALCNLLAWWTPDAMTIDRLFRQSALMRTKWDRAARTGETYGEGTIRRALADVQREQVA